MRTTTLVFAPPPLREMADARSASPSSRLLELEADADDRADEALPEYFTRPDSSEIHHMQPRVTQRKDAHQEDLAATAAATSSAATSSAAAESMGAVPSDDAAVQPMPQLPRRRRVVLGRTKPRAPSKTAKVLAEEAAAGVRVMSEAISEDAAARARAIREAISSAMESKLASEAAKWQAGHQSAKEEGSRGAQGCKSGRFRWQDHHSKASKGSASAVRDACACRRRQCD